MPKHQFGLRSERGTYTDSYTTEDAEIYGESKIINSKIYAGKIFDKSTVVDSTITGLNVIAGEPTIRKSFVGGRAIITGRPYILNSMIIDDVTVSDRPVIEHSELHGQAKVMDFAVVSHADISGNATIAGNAKIYGKFGELIKIDGWNYIHTGVWNRPPIHKVAPLSRFTLNECTNGNVDIGCICNKPEKFLKAGYRYMEILGFTKEQTDEIKDLLSDLLKEVELVK